MDDLLADVMKEDELLAGAVDSRQPYCTNTDLVCLNFKVPLRVRQQFKICAARDNMTMTELLLRLLDDCLRSADATNPLSRPNDSQGKEIKK